MKHLIVCLFAFVCTIAIPATAQELTTVPFDSNQWDIVGDNTEVLTYQGRQSLFAKGGAGLLRNANFLEGIIEFDMAIPVQRGFPGIFFRMEDDANYEEFYIRPHQSGNPDASQYSPVNNGLSGWQLYHGAGFSGQISYEYDTWMPVRLVVKGDEADIYIKNMDEPFLHVNDLKRAPFTGGIGLKGSGTGAYFSNFRYTTTAPDKLIGSAEKEVLASDLTITRWVVSEAISEASLEGKTSINKKTTRALKWASFNTEPSGLINLATTTPATSELNTVFARLSITSDQEQIKKLTFAFSDRIRIYLNGNILYSGQDGFRSRDYRYLGTIGYFDDVYLPLKEGNNELLIAISEDFGGWGLKAQFDSKAGLSWTTR